MSSTTAGPRSTIQLLQEFSVPLITGVVLAVAWANADHASYAALLHWSPLGEGSHVTFHFLVNDVFMAFFFGIATKEITESCLPGGALNPPRKAINPLLGTLGGVLGPVGVYFLWCQLTGDTAIRGGWGIPTATDIALAWLVARIAFGPRHPAVSFLLLLAVADDGLGLGIIAIFYPDPMHPVQPAYLGLVAAAMAFAYLLKRSGVRDFRLYVFGPGVLSWAGLYFAHLHPALTLVPVIPFLPHGRRDDGLFEEREGYEHHSTLDAFEHAFKAPVDFGLFAFGVANAGVVMSSVGNATYAVLVALLLGKTAGIFTFSMIGHRLGFRLPDGMDARSLLVAGLVAGMGLTVALFVAGVAFTDPGLQGAAKMGALGSAVAAPLAVVLARLLRVRRPEPELVPARVTLPPQA